MARMFGTNGVRGVVNEDMTAALALQMGKAIGSVMNGHVAVATDTRLSADMLRTAVAAGLMAVGCDVVNLGVVPTPALQYFVRMHPDISCGVMITASHNPPEFNGIKVIAADGTEASREQEAAVEEAYGREIPSVVWDKVGSTSDLAGAGDVYVDAVASKVDVAAIRAAGLTVVLDCTNGAAYYTSPLLLKRLGVRAITLNGNPQGEFPGHLSEPTEENLGELKAMVRDTGAALGIAHDGDADRCVFVDNRGRFVAGDKSLAVLARYLAQDSPGGTVVTPVATSALVEDVVRSAGGNVVYTAVGSPIVARTMMTDGAIFGGEENGGLIFPSHQYCRDGAMSLAKMLECIVRVGPLAEQLDRLPQYFTEKRKVKCPDGLKAALMQYFDARTEGIRKDRTDGIKLLFDNGWVLARPSGTEPIFRVYAESKDGRTAADLADKYERLVNEFLQSAPAGAGA